MDRMLARLQRGEHDPVAVRNGGLRVAGDARIKYGQARVPGESEQTRRGAVVEEVLQWNSVYLERQFRRVIDKEDGAFRQEVFQALARCRLEVRVRAGIVIDHVDHG